jgi:hypothetical protein
MRRLVFSLVAGIYLLFILISQAKGVIPRGYVPENNAYVGGWSHSA